MYDEHGDDLQSCTTQFRLFGARTSFEGAVTTVRCHDDNVILKATLGDPGAGRVLVVDGGGSPTTALMGDLIAGMAASNGWEGVIIHGAVRDVEALSKINIGIKALSSNPRKSRKDGAGEKDVEVSFGEVTFTPGCHLYSDADGILVTRETGSAATVQRSL
ncbi:ribonuclease E activity regulator RraA [Streptomyces sporangiiformans]|uniref:ribonuclease E activity regulator RraA n=1 Tax=Streptomyces sporangiiformans TaxID=2315329 RepID=UPI001F08938E|nr:ribonuclease E activity regulator RraA [Streptomyces sporangiiformans]